MPPQQGLNLGCWGEPVFYQHVTSLGLKVMFDWKANPIPFSFEETDADARFITHPLTRSSLTHSSPTRSLLIIDGFPHIPPKAVQIRAQKGGPMKPFQSLAIFQTLNLVMNIRGNKPLKFKPQGL